jgi:hypothetical protein
MQNVNYELKLRSTLMIFFAFLSVISAAATTIVPLVIHA